MGRESRLVVLPEWQGFGIGPLVSNTMGDRILASGMCLFSKTHHPRMGQTRELSDRWRATKKNLKLVQNRRPYCHQYYGSTQHGNMHLVGQSPTTADLVPSEYWLPYAKQYYGLKRWKTCFLFKRGVCTFGAECFFNHT